MSMSAQITMCIRGAQYGKSEANINNCYLAILTADASQYYIPAQMLTLAIFPRS